VEVIVAVVGIVSGGVVLGELGTLLGVGLGIRLQVVVWWDSLGGVRGGVRNEVGDFRTFLLFRGGVNRLVDMPTSGPPKMRLGVGRSKLRS